MAQGGINYIVRQHEGTGAANESHNLPTFQSEGGKGGLGKSLPTLYAGVR